MLLERVAPGLIPAILKIFRFGPKNTESQISEMDKLDRFISNLTATALAYLLQHYEIRSLGALQTVIKHLDFKVRKSVIRFSRRAAISSRTNVDFEK